MYGSRSVTNLLESVFLHGEYPCNLGITPDSQLGGLERAVVPGDAGETVLGAVALLLRAARAALEQTCVLHLILNLMYIFM